MALRKEKFHYDPHKEQQSMKKAHSPKWRIEIDVDSELSARIIAAAEQQKLPVKQYLEGLLDEIIPSQSGTPNTRRSISRETIERIRQFREQLLQERGGIPFDNSVDLLREAHEERERELDF